MRICIYCESLRTATSGTPMRAMIKELIGLRSADHFLLVIRKGYEQDPILTAFFESLSHLSNWKIKVDSLSRKVSNVLGLLRYRDYCRVTIKADVYLNPDCNSLGAKAHPVIVTVHDLSSFQALELTSYRSQWQLWLRRFMISNGVREADKIVAISAYTQKETGRRFPGVKHKIQVIYNGINDEWLDMSSQNGHYTPGAYWIWWGMISARKNLFNLIKAYAGLRRSNSKSLPTLRVIYGNPQVPADLLQLVDDEQLQDDVIFEKRKPLKELIEIVSNSSGLVFPSFIEGFGMPVIESFARGVPVLTSDTTSLKEMSGGLGILVDPFSINSISTGLMELQKTDRSMPGPIQNRKTWAMEFTPARAAQQYSRLIEECAIA